MVAAAYLPYNPARVNVADMRWDSDTLKIVTSPDMKVKTLAIMAANHKEIRALWDSLDELE